MIFETKFNRSNIEISGLPVNPDLRSEKERVEGKKKMNKMFSVLTRGAGFANTDIFRQAVSLNK